MKNAVLGSTALALFFLPGPTRANLIQNGGFEQPSVSYSQQFGGGGQGLTGWTVTSGSVQIDNSHFWQAYEGTQSLDLFGYANINSLYQSFATVPGQTYSFSFAYANNDGYSAGNAPILRTGNFSISENGQSLLSAILTHSTSQEPTYGNFKMDWNTYATTFVAESDVTTLTFFSSEKQGGLLVDNVNVSQYRQHLADSVSMPALLGIGLGALMLFRHWLARRPQAVLAKSLRR